MSRLNDPIEAMKIKPNQAKKEPAAPPPRDPPPEHVAAMAAAAASRPIMAPRKLLRVVKGGRVSFEGQLCNIPEGDLLDASSYSPAYQQRMIDAGIVLEAVVA